MAINIRVNTTIPAKIEEGEGISVTKTDGAYTLTLDLQNVPLLEEVTAPNTTYLVALAPGNVWRRTAYSEVVDMVGEIENGDRGDIVIASNGASLTIDPAALQSLTTDITTTADLQAADLILTPSASLLPTETGQLTIEATDDSTITFRYMGSDDIVRSGTLTLAEPDPPVVLLDFVNDTYTG